MSREGLAVNRGGKTTIWAMHQFHRMFSGCKTPGETIDTLNDYFKTGIVLRLLIENFIPKHICNSQKSLANVIVLSDCSSKPFFGNPSNVS